MTTLDQERIRGMRRRLRERRLERTLSLTGAQMVNTDLEEDEEGGGEAAAAATAPEEAGTDKADDTDAALEGEEEQKIQAEEKNALFQKVHSLLTPCCGF